MKRVILVLAALAFVATGQSRADMINLQTDNNASSWLITGAGAVNAPAYQIPGTPSGRISITSTGTNTGSFVNGGTLSSFTGLWTAVDTFFLPANAINVTFTFTGLLADDRVVALLNNTIIGGAGIQGGGEGYGSGYITGLPSDPTNQVFDYTMGTTPANNTPGSFSGSPSGTITSGFILGGENTLELVVNNTHTGIGGTTQTFSGSGDFTRAQIDATVTYDIAPTPEPSSLALLGIGLAGMAAYGWRRRKQPVPA